MVIESTFHLSEEVVRALKLRAVNENKKFSRVAEEGLRQYLGLPKFQKKEKPRKANVKK
ncbi:MAG: hypothetical protein WBZ36_30715 [Candidatus Nitrosopolaris sp.]|jgi:hypothetical protein